MKDIKPAMLVVGGLFDAEDCCQLFIPNAFSPNGDGRNDAFGVRTLAPPRSFQLNIYNRWGQLIFSTSVNGQGWDGRIGGQLQSTGTFVWTVKAMDYTGKAYFQKGIFTLIR